MKPVAAVVAITVLVLTGLALAGPLSGAASAAPKRVAPQPAAREEVAAAGPLNLALTQVEPRIVTADGPGTLTVTGTLTNTGDRSVDELVIRVQRGDPLGTEGELRDALDGNAGTDAVTPQFVPLPGELPPGGQVPIRLAVPLRGPPGSSLALAATGVHELLVNVNAAPRGGPRARLAAVRMLLPVLSLPPSPAAADQGGGVPDAPAESPFALLFPVADTPRQLSTVPGEPTLLTDDDLAASLAPDGRLGGLVAALAAAAPVGSRVRDATCLAIDPDLVETAAAMRSGYQVIGPDGRTVPGTGAEVAGRWVDSLTAVARDGCVIALPYADADLVALTRGGLGERATTAVTDGRRVLADRLQTPVVPGVTWPADGVVDDATLDRISQADGRSLVLSAEGVEPGRTPRSAGVLPIAGGRPAQFAVLTDPLLTLAAAGAGQPTTDGTGGGAVAASTPAGTSTPLSTQDAIGALAFRSQDGVETARTGGPLVLAPPPGWAAEGTGARALLQAVGGLLEDGQITPRGIDDVLAAGPSAATPARAVVYPLRAGGREIPTTVVDTIRATAADVTDLRSAAVEGSGVGVDPDEAFAPLLRGLVRPTSAAWRGRPDAAATAAAAAADRIADLRAAVRVLEPPSPYSLGTSNAPILITVANGLPFTVKVGVELASTSGLRVAPIDMQQVPPLGRRQARVSAEVTRSGQFTVQASVRSPDGAPLGPPSRLRVRSTAYGTITVWLTGSAGVLLVVLAVRRVLRRARAEPDRHVRPDRPDPTSDPQPDPLAPARPGSGSPVRPPPDRGHGPRAAGPTGDPFPDPLAVTGRLPPAPPHPGRPGPGPQPPRVPSPGSGAAPPHPPTR